MTAAHQASSNNKLVGPESDTENELWIAKLLKAYENKQIQCNSSALCWPQLLWRQNGDLHVRSALDDFGILEIY